MNTVHGVRTRMTGVFNVGLEIGEFFLRRVTILRERIVILATLANESLDLLERDPQPLPCDLLTEHLSNLGELGISRDAGKTRVDLDGGWDNSGRVGDPNCLAERPLLRRSEIVEMSVPKKKRRQGQRCDAGGFSAAPSR